MPQAKTEPITLLVLRERAAKIVEPYQGQLTDLEQEALHRSIVAAFLELQPLDALPQERGR